MSEDTATIPAADQAADHKSRPHKLQCKVRPALPKNAEPWTLVWVARAGHLVIPLPDRPGQRTMIEHAGGVWDPETQCWRFANAKYRDQVQAQIDDAASKAADTVRGGSHKLAPGLNLVGTELFGVMRELEQVKRHKDKIEPVDLATVKPATLIDYVKKTGVSAVLRYLLEQELSDAVIKAVTKQLADLEGGRVAAKVSRGR